MFVAMATAAYLPGPSAAAAFRQSFRPPPEEEMVMAESIDRDVVSRVARRCSSFVYHCIILSAQFVVAMLWSWWPKFFEEASFGWWS